MTTNIARARWWLAYPVALALLLILDAALGFWRPLPSRLPEQFSPAYLNLYVGDAPRNKPVIAFLGDSVLWGYKIPEADSAANVLQRRFPASRMLNMSYEGGSTPNSAVLLRYALHAGVPLAGAVINVNIKEFNHADSAYRTLHPSLERTAEAVLTPGDRRVLKMHPAVGLNPALNRFVERYWRFYRLRADLCEMIFGTDDMAGALVRSVQNITGTAAAQELAHRPTSDKFLGTYDLAPIDDTNVGMQYYRILLRELCAAKIPAIVFLTPTNHGLLHDYIDVPEYDANLHALMAVPHCPRVTVLNLDRAAPSATFIDNDHLNAAGQRILVARLSPYLRKMIR